MQRKQRIDMVGGTVLVAFSALLGLNQVLVKFVNSGFQPTFQAGLRSACAFLPVLIYALLMRKKLSLSDGSFWPGIATGLLFSAEFIFLFQALDYTTVSRASILFYAMPFWVAVGAHFLIPGERLTKMRLAGLVLAIAGVSLALSDNAKPATELAWLGDLLCLAGGAFWACIALVSRTTKMSNASPEMNLLYQLAVSSIAMLAIAPFFGPLIREVTPVIIAIFTFQVFAVVCIGFLTWFWILSIYPASDMASFGFLAPLFGVFFGWLVFDEQITLRFAAALVLVCLGILLVNRKPR